MVANSAWKTFMARVSFGSYIMPQVRKVRTDGERFQIHYDRSLPLPCGDSFAAWVEEMTTVVEDLEDVTIDYESANEEYSTEINAHGWMDATPEQVAAIKERDFS